jgi:hypothetical protein
MDQHFYNGFIKRAQDYGLSVVEAERLVKQAMIVLPVRLPGMVPREILNDPIEDVDAHASAFGGKHPAYKSVFPGRLTLDQRDRVQLLRNNGKVIASGLAGGLGGGLGGAGLGFLLGKGVGSLSGNPDLGQMLGAALGLGTGAMVGSHFASKPFVREGAENFNKHIAEKGWLENDQGIRRTTPEQDEETMDRYGRIAGGAAVGSGLGILARLLMPDNSAPSGVFSGLGALGGIGVGALYHMLKKKNKSDNDHSAGRGRSMPFIV